MNLLVVVNKSDFELAQKIGSSQLFTNTNIQHDCEELNNAAALDISVIILSDQVVNYEDLPFIREKYNKHTLFYMLSDNSSRFNKNIETIAHVNDVNIIYSKQTVEQILRYVESVLKPRDISEKKRVVVFCGTQPQVGVTSTALSVASRLGALTGTKIGVLGLNPWNPGDFFLRYSGHYLDELSTQLANKALTSKDLISSMVNCNSFYYLAGNRSVKKQFKYYQEDINYLIELAKEVFDLVLVDAGAHFDNAMSLQALAKSDINFLVTNQQSCGYRAWSYSFEQIIEPLGYKKSDFLLILNEYLESSNLLTAKQIAQEFGIPLLRYITNLGSIGLNAEREQFLLLDINDQDYLKDINSLAQTLVKIYSLPLLPTLEAINSKKTLFGRLFSFKEV